MSFLYVPKKGPNNILRIFQTLRIFETYPISHSEETTTASTTAFKRRDTKVRPRSFVVIKMRNYEGPKMTIRGSSSSPFLLLYIYNVPSWTTHTIFGRRCCFFFSEAPVVFTKSALPRKKFQMPGKHAKVKLLLLLLLLL